jgi:hypothetical protein
MKFDTLVIGDVSYQEITFSHEKIEILKNLKKKIFFLQLLTFMSKLTGSCVSK